MDMQGRNRPPKVSVIVPVYQAGRYLARCLESVAAQTLADIEIVCVNDGSTDGSLSILEAFRERDARFVVISQENGGYGKAMNTGLRAAAGEYIAIAEPDDYLDSAMLEALYAAASRHGLDFVKSDYITFSEETGEETYIPVSRDEADYGKVFCPAADPSALRFRMNTWTGIYRRNFLLDNHIHYHESPGAAYQDNGFFFQTFVFGRRAMLLKGAFYHYRIDNPASSINSGAKMYATEEEYAFIERLLKRDAGLWQRFAPMFWKKRFDSYEGTFRRIAPELRGEYASFMSQRMRGAYMAGYVQRDVFSRAQWWSLVCVMDDPKGYRKRYEEPKRSSARVFWMKRLPFLALGRLKRIGRHVSDDQHYSSRL